MSDSVIILGAGVTGLAAGWSSGAPVYEASEVPGGICSSYYVAPGESKHFHSAPPNGEAYRFETGGGHWIFGGDPSVLRFISSLAPVKTYTRKSAVYFPDQNLLVPYPIQNHLRYFGIEIAVKALCEMVEATRVTRPVKTMKEWLRMNFGPTLCEIFFDSFHELYTAGLWEQIAPQDAYKSPIDISLVIRGAFQETEPIGYNTTFVYPIDGLNTLAQRLAQRCTIHYTKKAIFIDVKEKVIYFEDASKIRYDILVSTLPLNRMMEITGLQVDEEPDPFTSVLVINIGAIKGPHCPKEHWVYIPRSEAGFHRVGFYSNVDPSFLPASARQSQNRVSIYVEKAYIGGQKLEKTNVQRLSHEIVKELQKWGWIEQVEVIDPTWIEVAYTWSWPNSKWREKAIKTLQQHDIYQVGRYGRWVFQGIADSIRDGLIVGGSLRYR